MGWTPTPWRLAVFANWHAHEGMPLEETWNPIATTRLSSRTSLNTSFDIGYGPGNWNSVPVRVYATAADGIQATVETLSLDYYPNVRECFRDQVGYQTAVAELATYVGSVSYGQSLVNFMNTTTASKGDDEVTKEEFDALKAEVTQLRKIVGGPAADDYDLLVSIQNQQTALTEHEKNHDSGGPHKHETGPGISV